jgi:MFS family permease
MAGSGAREAASTAPPSPRSPLRRPDFARLWAGGLISDIGDWLLLVGLPVAVFQLTGSALATSTVFVVELIPSLVVGQVGGVLVDRWDRRRILVAASVLQAIALLPLLAVTSADQLWIVYPVAALEACLARLSSPALASLVPTVVSSDELVAANSLSAVSANLARLVGSPLGGIAVQFVGLGGIVAFDAATFLVAAGLTSLVRARRTADSGRAVDEASRPSVFRDWLDGIATIRRTPTLGPVLAIGALSQLAQGLFVVLFVVFVLRELGGSGADIGVIRGVQAIGGIAGGAAIGLIGGRFEAVKLAGWGFVAFGLVSLATWNAPLVTTATWVYAALFVAAGVPGVATATGLMTMVQTAAPSTHLGRVIAAFEAFAGALQAVGVLIAGALADSVGVVPILEVQASIYLGCGIALLAMARRRAKGARTATASDLTGLPA